MKKNLILAAFCLTGSLFPAQAAPDPLSQLNLEIPYQRFVLKNGLTLIVHEDHKAPIVAVNVWYHVGSKNERPGKTGFAHLFEHLMFTGSENFKGAGDQRGFFELMEKIGATDLNGTTSEDRTDYFENVPTNALDIALWLESDRMGHLLGVVDQNKLDVQRGVVQNEKRQGENEPYGITEELITRGTAPVGHPYSWTVIGSMEDLSAASLEDVHQWFKTYYGPANAVLVLAGDIDPATALRKVEHYFGDIPAGPPVAKFDQWVPRVVGTRRQKVGDRVPQARLYKVWNVPRYGETETAQLELAADILASGKSSRLYKRLVYDEQIATSVSASVNTREIGGQFIITVSARPGVDLARLEKGLDEELARLQKRGLTAAELQRAKAGKLAGFVRGAERIGGFGGKSDILAMNQTFRGSPDYYKTILDQYRNATPAAVQRTVQSWLQDDVYILEVQPFPEHEMASQSADRSRVPDPGAPPAPRFPELQRATLSNGLKVLLAERHAVPTVSFSLLLDAGYASDQNAVPGTARLAMRVLDSGTGRRTALQISDELAALGAELRAGSGLDFSSVSLNTLTAAMDRALDLYADVILHPSFPEAEFQRAQKQLTARIQQERTEPFSMALRVFPQLLYGAGHAYSNPLTGSGTEESVAKITRQDLQRFHQSWFKADHATLIVVGDTTLRDLTPRLEKLLASWRPGPVPAKNIGIVEPPAKTTVCLVDRPGSLQSVILAGTVAPPSGTPDEIAIDTMNNILGGSFSSRVNMNLREDKHWSYGAFSFLFSARGQRPFVAYGPVQTDKTKESMVEMDRELRGILGPRPIQPDELTKAQLNQTLQLPGSWETMDAVSGLLGELVRYGLPDNYYTTYADRVRALQLADLNRVAPLVVKPDHMVWVVIGDRAKIEAGLRELSWGEVRLIDADGHPVK